MGGFFSGRRCLGCFALLMASAVSCLWMRSYFYFDFTCFNANNEWHQIVSAHGQVTWVTLDNPGPVMWWATDEIDPEMEMPDLSDLRLIAYWWLALPLTVISAALLLWPQRRRSAIEATPPAQ